ncbi:MAG: hypothetical protein JRG80_10585 [Deltaproteobacteria bacterium]|nr:hypothetical protein [Deltaproteobacteria bacterium]
MKSFLLQEFSRLILPLALLLGLALLLKGHDAPGGGFVGGLSFAVAGILGFTAYGVRRFHAAMAVEPDGPIAWKWHTTLVFEIGVVMTIGGALSAAALWLWETPLRTEEDD